MQVLLLKKVQVQAQGAVNVLAKAIDGGETSSLQQSAHRLLKV